MRTPLLVLATALAAIPCWSQDRELGGLATDEPVEVRLERGAKVVYVGGVKADELVRDLSEGIQELELRIGEAGTDSDEAGLNDLRASRKALKDELARLKRVIEAAQADKAEADLGQADSAYGSSSAGEPDQAQGHAGAAAAARRREALGAAVAKALKAAGRLQASLGGPAGMARPDGWEEAGLRDAVASPLAGLGAARAAGDGSVPGCAGTMVLGGYRGVYEKLGLSVAAGPDGMPAVVRKDGSPASEPEVAALRQAFAGEPKALARRPDFFQVLPRSDFDRLKEAYESAPALRGTLFKDMETSGPDLRWSRSCAAVSGECNAHAGGLSYRQGDFVPPEDLRAAAKELPGKEPGESRSPEDLQAQAGSEEPEEDEDFRRLIAELEDEEQEGREGDGRLAGAGGRLSKGILADAVKWLGLGGAGEGTEVRVGGMETPERGRDAGPASPAAVRRPGVPRPAARASGARASSGRAWRLLPFIAAGIALIIVGLRRRRP